MSSKMATLMPCFVVVPPYDRDGGEVASFY